MGSVAYADAIASGYAVMKMLNQGPVTMLVLATRAAGTGAQPGKVWSANGAQRFSIKLHDSQKSDKGTMAMLIFSA